MTQEPEQFFFDGWEEDDEPTPEELARSVWRRRVILVVAVITVVAMAAIPVFNLIDQGSRPVADNGLEVCGFDYCEVQDAVRAAGFGPEMVLLSTTYLSDGDAADLADAMIDYLGEDPVTFEVVDRLDWRIKGQYEPDTRTIRVERPVSAWIVLHEVAHVPTSGHGDEFVSVLIDLAAQLR